MDMTKRAETLKSETKRLFNAVGAKVQDYCGRYDLIFRPSGLDECANEVWETNFGFGNYSLLLHLNHSQLCSYFSIRIVRIHYGTLPGEFTAEVVGQEERFQMFLTPEDWVVWHSENNPGEKYNQLQMIEHCMDRVLSVRAK